MKKRTLKQKLQYWFDCMMSKGFVSTMLLLLIATASAVGIIGIIAYFVADEGGVIFQLWSSMLYTLDAGNLAGVPTDNIAYLILMSLATVCGIFLTGTLIGFISNGIEDRLEKLQKGNSVVQEDNHTVIIGFNKDIHVLLRELTEANANKKDACIVVLGSEEKSAMEDEISDLLPDSKTTRIICRSGGLHETYSLERCSIETCKSVIINVDDDAETIKIILALSTYIKDKKLLNRDLCFITYLKYKENIEAATIAGEGRVRAFYAKDAIARIIANTCRQHGLSQVLTDIFSFSGDELYIEKVDALTGKTFKEATLSFSNAVAVGIYTNGKTRLNPPMDTVIGKDDCIILFEEDDGAYKLHEAKKVSELDSFDSASAVSTHSNNLLILGSNNKVPIILSEYAKYIENQAEVVIADNDFDLARLKSYDNLNVSLCKEDITASLLKGFIGDGFNNILLLNDDSQDAETSDSKTLMRLIFLRDIADKTEKDIAITTEMRSVDNQKLAKKARVDDFVIGSNFLCLLMAQISEDAKLAPVIEELLDEDGSEFYMKKASQYVPTGREVDGYTLTESAARKGEVFVGYRKMEGDRKLVVNPCKSDKVTFGALDQIVVISEN